MHEKTPKTASGESPEAAESATEGGAAPASEGAQETRRPVEIGGRKGPDPTRYGDWEKNGRCIDF